MVIDAVLLAYLNVHYLILLSMFHEYAIMHISHDYISKLVYCIDIMCCKVAMRVRWLLQCLAIRHHYTTTCVLASVSALHAL